MALLLLASAPLLYPGGLSAQAVASAPTPAGGEPRREVAPGVSLLATVERYRVRGHDAGELAASMREAGPRLEGVPVWGLTRWALESRYRPSVAGEGCSVVHASVEVRAEVVLPRWEDEARAPTPLRILWAAFRDAVVRHEEGHRDRAVAAGTELREALLELEAPRCTLLAARADSLAAAVMDRWGERQHAYDRATGGGRAQGVIWPPGG